MYIILKSLEQELTYYLCRVNSTRADPVNLQVPQIGWDGACIPVLMLHTSFRVLFDVVMGVICWCMPHSYLFYSLCTRSVLFDFSTVYLELAATNISDQPISVCF